LRPPVQMTTARCLTVRNLALISIFLRARQRVCSDGVIGVDPKARGSGFCRPLPRIPDAATCAVLLKVRTLWTSDLVIDGRPMLGGRANSFSGLRLTAQRSGLHQHSLLVPLAAPEGIARMKARTDGSIVTAFLDKPSTTMDICSRTRGCGRPPIRHQIRYHSFTEPNPSSILRVTFSGKVCFGKNVSCSICLSKVLYAAALWQGTSRQAESHRQVTIRRNMSIARLRFSCRAGSGSNVTVDRAWTGAARIICNARPSACGPCARLRPQQGTRTVAFRGLHGCPFDHPHAGADGRRRLR